MTWNNSTLLDGDAIEEVGKLKAEPGRDLFVVGMHLPSSGLRAEQIRAVLVSADRPRSPRT